MESYAEDIVISGMSARLSGCAGLQEFWTKLMKPSTATEQKNRSVASAKSGVACDFSDLLALLIDVSREAILDAGVNPSSLKDSSTGVFLSCNQSDPDSELPVVNRLSSHYGFAGPVYCTHSSTAPSLRPFQEACRSLSAADTDSYCQSALVGALDIKSDDGHAEVNVILIFIQKSSTAQRCYLSVHSVHSGNDLENDADGHSAFTSLSEVLNKAYQNYDWPNLIETHFSASVNEEIQSASDEVRAILEVFATHGHAHLPGNASVPSRRTLLLIASPTSEFRSGHFLRGFRSILKLILSLHHKILPGNADLRKLLHAVQNAEILTEPTSISSAITPSDDAAPRSSLFGMNAIGTDSAMHLVLRHVQANNACGHGHNSQLMLPALIPFGSRSREQLERTFAKFESQHRNLEFEMLIRAGMEEIDDEENRALFRGYLLKSASEPAAAIVTSIQDPPPEKRPLWFVFSGMGTLWEGMLNDLMNFEIFANSIRKATDIMRPYDIDLFEFLSKGSDALLDRYMGVCFIAIGVALTDLLIALDLKPDGFLGHSGGEILCAYLDGCITQAEALIAYFHKDECVLECSDGAMASIQLTWEQAVKKCPPWIYPACHNSRNNVTIAGLAKDVTKFLDKIKSEDNISSSLVNTSGVAYHTRYLKPIWSKYESLVRSAVTSNKPRSSKWLSTSIPQKDWATKPYTGMADYLLHNMINPVLFYPVLKNIPKNAVVLEISANSFCVSSIEKSLPRSCTVFGLMRKDGRVASRSAASNTCAEQILNAIGKLYQFGMNPKINRIYPKLEYPLRNSSIPVLSQFIV